MPATAFTINSANLTQRLHRIGGLLGTFFLGQGLVQVIGLITGFVLVHWLSKEEYAKVGLTFGFQCMTASMVDLGFTGSILALVGNRGNDPRVFGAYIKASKFFRLRLLLIVLPISFLAFCALAAKHQWDWTTRLVLFACIAASLCFQGVAAWYSAPLLSHRKLYANYRVGVVTSVFRLLSFVTLYFTSVLVAATQAIVNSISIFISAVLLQKAARPFVIEPAESDPAIRREMFRYLAPQIPLIIFFAFEGQITLLVISVFGKTDSIAEMAALGRIGQLFAVLSAANGILVLPYFATLPRLLLVKRHLQILLLVLLGSGTIIMLSFLFPAPLLWLLGKQYSGLHQEVGWMVANACLALLAGVIGTVNAARKFIFWRANFITIAVLIAVQVFGVLFMKLNTTLNVLHFSILLGLAHCSIHFSIFLYGLRRIK